MTNDESLPDLRSMPFPPEDASVIIVVALDIEKAAVKLILDEGSRSVDGLTFGKVPSADGGDHNVVVAVLPETGNSPSAALSAELLGKFPDAALEMFVGIAGGIPNVEDAEAHVRLGDVVVSDSVEEHDFGKTRAAGFQHIGGRVGLPSARLISVTKDLVGDARIGIRPWEAILEARFSAPIWSRPSTEVLTDLDGNTLDHPVPDPYRKPGVSRLHLGLIASGNTVVKDAGYRASLQAMGASAVEMEAAGAGTAAWQQSRQYLIVRGIADYADSNKNNDWHEPAAASAASVARCLLERSSSTAGTSRVALVGEQVVSAEVLRLKNVVSEASSLARMSTETVRPIIGRWTASIATQRSRFISRDPKTGERQDVDVWNQQEVNSYVSEILEECKSRSDSVSELSVELIGIADQLNALTGDIAIRLWLERLAVALDALADAVATWPSNEKVYLPPPLDDGGWRESAIEELLKPYEMILRRLDGFDVPSPPAISSDAEISELPITDQFRKSFSELDAWFHATDRSFDPLAHASAVKELARFQSLRMCEEPSFLLFPPDFAAAAAAVAKFGSATEDWPRVLEEGAAAEPLGVSIALLRAYVIELRELGLDELLESALALLRSRLETLESSFETEDFWESHSPSEVRRLCELHVAEIEGSCIPSALTLLANRDRQSLCGVLRILAHNMLSENAATNTQEHKRSLRHASVSHLVDVTTVRQLVIELMPEAQGLSEFEADFAEAEDLRLAAGFLLSNPAIT